MILPALLLALLINLAPLPLGSDRPLPWALNAILAGGLLLLTLLTFAFRWRHGPQVLARPIAWPLGLFVAVLAWIGFQILSVGDVPLAHPIWAETAPLLNQTTGTISVSPIHTIEALSRLLTALAVGLCAYIVGRDARRAAFLLQAFVFCAGLYAIYGLVRLSSSATQILWFDETSSGYLTASFIGRNNAATYFGLATVTSFALLTRRWRHVVGDDAAGARERTRRLVGSLASSLGVYFLVFATLLVALLLTGSRGGISATLIGIAALILLQFLRTRRLEVSQGAASFSGALVALFSVFAIFQMSGAKFAERLASADMAKEGRFLVWSDTLAAISDHLWLGSGFGTFEDILPVYRSAVAADISLWDKAHNDYLELFLGLGLPAGLLVIAAFTLMAWRCLKGAFERRRNSIFSMVAVAAIVLIAVHAGFDFSLQIQAVALVFAMLLGLGLAQSYSETAR